MLKILAALCLLSAMLLAVQSKNVTSEQAVSSISGFKHTGKDARSAQRDIAQRSKARRKRSLIRSQTSQSALLEAAGLNLRSSDLINWDAAKFTVYLSNINEDDAQCLVRDLITSDQKGAKLNTPGTARITVDPSSGSIQIAQGSSWITRRIVNTASYNSKNAVLAGLLGELSSRDFVGTLEFMESLQIKHKNRITEQYLYDAILKSGFRQDAKKAWQTYIARFTTSATGKFINTMG